MHRMLDTSIVGYAVCHLVIFRFLPDFVCTGIHLSVGLPAFSFSGLAYSAPSWMCPLPSISGHAISVVSVYDVVDKFHCRHKLQRLPEPRVPLE